MLSDKIFINALVVSMILHFFIFVPLPRYAHKAQKQISAVETEFVYQAVKKAPVDSRLIAKEPEKRILMPAKAVLPKEQKTHSAGASEELKPDTKSKAPEKIVPKISDEPALLKPVPKALPSKQAMIISSDEKDLSNEPVYLDYYNAVRGRIYNTANANKPHYYMQGSVNIIFTLDRYGSVLQSAINHDKSTGNLILQRHALASVEGAAPFPFFHESMKEHQLTLRITISFEK